MYNISKMPSTAICLMERLKFTEQLRNKQRLELPVATADPTVVHYTRQKNEASTSLCSGLLYTNHVRRSGK